MPFVMSFVWFPGPQFAQEFYLQHLAGYNVHGIFDRSVENQYYKNHK